MGDRSASGAAPREEDFGAQHLTPFDRAQWSLLNGERSDLRPTEVQWWHHLVQHISMLRHMQDFSTGIVDSRHVMFYLSLTAVFLFFTLKSVESRRWK